MKCVRCKVPMEAFRCNVCGWLYGTDPNKTGSADNGNAKQRKIGIWDIPDWAELTDDELDEIARQVAQEKTKRKSNFRKCEKCGQTALFVGPNVHTARAYKNCPGCGHEYGKPGASYRCPECSEPVILNADKISCINPKCGWTLDLGFTSDPFGGYGRGAQGDNRGAERVVSNRTLAQAYRALEVHPGASTEVVKKVYREKAKRHHPDKGGNAETFKVISEAYATIMRSRGEK